MIRTIVPVLIVPALIGSLLTLAPAFAAEPVAAEPVAAEIADWPTIQEKIRSADLAVVDLWSLSCAPCVRELPHLGELAERHAGRLECFAVSVDYDGRRRRPAETYRDRVTDLLTTLNMTATRNYVCGTPSDDVLASVDAVSIPAVILYRRGEVVAKFVDAGQTAGFDYEQDVAPEVERLLRR